VGRVRRVFLCFAVVATAALSAAAEEALKDHDHHAGHALGTVDFAVSCSAQAQTEFNHAVALLHHMTYPQARQAFERVATEFATSPYAADAKKQLDALKG